MRKVFKPSKPISSAKGVGIGKIVILTMCPAGGCPRMVITGKNAFFRDDYKGRVTLNSKLLQKLSDLK